ncbi:MAG: hypothetical protein AB8E15_07335 [Bdellovibrionales bacterium]
MNNIQVKPSLFLFLLLTYQSAFSLDLGLGFNSAASGRKVPSLNLATSPVGSVSTSLTSFGESNSYYYSSHFMWNLYLDEQVGQLFGAPVFSGFGLGAYYFEYEFSPDASSASALSDSDFSGGLSFFVAYYPLDWFHIRLDALFGWSDLETHLGLNFQDAASFSMGVSF